MNAWEKNPSFQCRASFIGSIFCPRKKAEVVAPVACCQCGYYMNSYLFFLVNKDIKITIIFFW